MAINSAPGFAIIPARYSPGINTPATIWPTPSMCSIRKNWEKSAEEKPAKKDTRFYQIL
jgi:hypothetical protein